MTEAEESQDFFVSPLNKNPYAQIILESVMAEVSHPHLRTYFFSTSQLFLTSGNNGIK
jgi:hypothetical protein